MTRLAILWSGIRLTFWLTLAEIGVHLLDLAGRHGALDDPVAVRQMKERRAQPLGVSPNPVSRDSPRAPW